MGKNTAAMILTRQLASLFFDRSNDNASKRLIQQEVENRASRESFRKEILSYAMVYFRALFVFSKRYILVASGNDI